MKFRLRKRLQVWLESEAASAEFVREASREEKAEQALRRVFSRIPRHRPSKGFSDRVLARAGVAFSGSSRPNWLPLPLFRAFVACCLVLAGTALVWLPAALLAVIPKLSWTGWGARITEGLTWLSQMVVDSLVVVEALWGVGSTVMDIISFPTFGVVSVVGLLISAAAMRALHDLIVPTRSV